MTKLLVFWIVVGVIVLVYDFVKYERHNQEFDSIFHFFAYIVLTIIGWPAVLYFLRDKS